MTGCLDYLLRWHRETPTSPAWWVAEKDGLRQVTWGELHNLVVAAAERLIGEPGNRVLSRIPNGLEWAVLDLACQARKLIHVPIDCRVPEDGIDLYRRWVRPRCLVDDADPSPPAPLPDAGRGEFKKSPHPRPLSRKTGRGEDEVATILFTSGTSGAPRGVMLSHESLIHNAVGKLQAVPQFASDRRLNLLPFSHAYARTCELTTWLLTGGSILCASNFDEVLRLAPIFQPTLFNAVPYVFEKLQSLLPSVDESTERRRQAFDELFGGRMRVLASGGAGLRRETFDYFADMGLPIIQGYGLTEASPVICSNRVDNPQADNVGPPIHDTELKIGDDQRLFVRGPGVMLGYWNDEEATNKKIVDGWLDTGDRVEQLSDGSIKILGRCDDRIVLSTGEKIDPAPIEERLLRMSKIQRAMLTGQGNRFVSAVIVSEEDEDSLLAAITSELSDLPRYAIPKRLIVETDDWSMESGLLNHKGGFIRRAVLDRYRFEIGRLYHPSLGRRQESLNPGQSDQQNGGSEDQRDHVQQ